MRSHYWGVLIVVVASGELDGNGTERLGPLLRKLHEGNDLILDLWDVTYCDEEGVAALETAIARASQDGWGLAVVADPAGSCARTLEAAGIPTFADRRAARAALQQ